MRFKRVLLVNPPHVDQGGYKPSPLGILYLAAYLRKFCRGLSLAVIDGAMDGESAVIQKINSFKPDLVGISALTPGRHRGLWVARMVKKRYPQAKTVFGNVHPTIMWKQMIEEYPEVDYIIRGEGEEALYELVSGTPIARIKNLVWRNRNKAAVDNGLRQMIGNLDSIPFPAWDMVDLHRYPPRGHGTVNGVDLTHEIRYPLIFSRGCMGACTFCSSWMIWKKYRSRKGGSVADEVQMLYDTYGARHFVFQDDTLTGSRDEIIKFCKEIIRRRLRIAIYGTTRVDQVDSEMLRIMKRAGFYEISYGIESGSPDMLKLINKRIDLAMIERAIHITQKAGIKANALIMYGLPGETKKDRLASRRFLKKIKPDETGSVGAVWIFPGTVLYEQAKQARLINDSFWLGKRPYQIYRGGIGKDPVDHTARLKDELFWLFGNTLPFKLFQTAAAYKDRFFKKIIPQML